MVSHKHVMAALLVSVSAMPVNASETVLYKYDALGRLVKTTQSGDINDGVITDLSYDPAGNRTNYEVAGSDGSGDGGATGATGPGTGGGGGSGGGGNGGGETPPSFSIANETAPEGDAFTFTVTKNGTVSNSYSVDYATADAPNEAVAGSDYVAVAPPITLTFAPSETSQTFTVTTIDDSAPESIEFFHVNLSNATSGATISDSQAAAQIDDNDSGNIPPDATDDSKIMARCAIAYQNLVANDTDQDGNTPLELVSLSGPGAAFTTIIPLYGGFHVNKFVEIQAPNVTATTFYTLDYVVKDSLGATDTGTLTVEVRAFGICP